MSDAVAADAPFPAIAFLLRHARRFPAGAAGAVLVLLLWLALRTGWIELAALAVAAAVVVHFVTRVAIDVVSLVAETLMPR